MDKKCFKCKKTKNSTHFHKNCTKKDGFSNMCKECTSKYKRLYDVSSYEHNYFYMCKICGEAFIIGHKLDKQASPCCDNCFSKVKNCKTAKEYLSIN